jgi:adenylate cyclase class IV
VRNLEFKARTTDLKATMSEVRQKGAELWGDLRQTDTYFRVPRGRLKLRETPTFPAELIYYERDEEAAGRPSNYIVSRCGEGAALREVLSAALDTWVVVRKRRTLLLLDTIRVHLDNVDALGSFVEIEVPVDESTTLRAIEAEAAARQRLDVLIEALGLTWEHCIRASYADLIAASRQE